MKIICLGNYPPRHCGIATFTENLVTAVLQAADLHGVALEVEVIAMNDGGKTYDYPAIVKQVIRHRCLDDYVQMAELINNSGAELLLLQHEFGIFGGESGVLLLALLRRITIPIVSTFHTVLQNPGFHQHEVMRKIAAYSSRIVVMNGMAIDFLVDAYGVPREKISRIEHGTPDFKDHANHLPPTPAAWSERRILLTFGLLGRSKGLETALRALPAIVATHPDVLYVVLGKTHPHVVQYSGEEYREFLHLLVAELQLQTHVVFINEYVSELTLMSYLKSADIYITPYLHKTQITSGALSYAVSAGCAVISTPYWHAEELLAHGRGCLFDFGNHRQLAAIVNRLLDTPEELAHLQHRARDYGAALSWPMIGKQYLEVFNAAINHCPDPGLAPRPRPAMPHPEFEVVHLKRLTDDTGLLQHARTSVPFYEAGYCLDDNARAIVVCLAAWNRFHTRTYLELLDKYLAYITRMQRKDGSFANYMTYERTVLDDSSDDSHGRVIWALGYLIRFAPTNSLFQLGHELFEHSLPLLTKLCHARGYANCILGVYHYLKRFPDQERFLRLLQVLADKLCEQFARHQREHWDWFENSMTYDNGLLPAALYRAYEISGQARYLRIADASRLFLESKCFRHAWLSLIGNRQWLHVDHAGDIFAQQPVDAMAMVLLYESAWEATGDSAHLDKLRLSFEWFLGHNDLNIGLLDVESKGCNDGIEEFNINRNQGAESNLAYLMSWLVAEPFFR
ncbi:MAG: glycosyltransferase [Verrucomicrobia bacterium]|nr:glycosyltransferase [Verrucomicrobiota bacterium]